MRGIREPRMLRSDTKQHEARRSTTKHYEAASKSYGKTLLLLGEQRLDVPQTCRPSALWLSFSKRLKEGQPRSSFGGLAMEV